MSDRIPDPDNTGAHCDDSMLAETLFMACVSATQPMNELVPTPTRHPILSAWEPAISPAPSLSDGLCIRHNLVQRIYLLPQYGRTCRPAGAKRTITYIEVGRVTI